MDDERERTETEREQTEEERVPVEDARGGFDAPDEPDLREEEAVEGDDVSVPAAQPPAH